MDALIRLAEAWWPLYAVHFIEVSLFILLVWAADRWMKLDTRLRYVLYLLALAKVFVPPFYAIPLPEFLTVSDDVPIGPVYTGVVSEVEVVVPVQVAPLPLAFYLFCLWGVSVVVWAGVTLWKNATFHRALSLAVPVDLAREVGSLGEARNMKVYAKASLRSPLLVGVVKPRLYLPSHWSSWSPEELRGVVAHELAHRDNRDIWVLIFQAIAMALFCINPLVWLLNRRLNFLRELRCDEAVLRETNLTPAEYGRLLFGFVDRRPAMSALYFNERGTALKKRLEYVLNFKDDNVKRSRWQLVIPVLIGLAIVPFSIREAYTQDEGDLEVMGLVEDEKKLDPTPEQPTTPPVPVDTDSSEIFEYDEVEEKPHPINIVTPVYPEKARKEKIEGKVVLKVVVNMDGSVSDVRVLEGPEIFRQAAIDAISQSQFKPAAHNGKAVPVWVVMPIEFSSGSTDSDLQLTSPVPIGADGNEVEIPRFFEVEATPELLQSVKFVYPTRVTVRLEFRVYEDGSVGDMKVLKGPEEFHQAAINAILQYRFKPGTLNGKVVPVRMTQSIIFRLPKQQTTPPASGDADSSKVLEFYMVEVKPKVLHSVVPVHPEEALRDSLEGKVFLKFMVNLDGSVSDIRVLRGEAIFHRAAIDAVSQFRYKPAEHNGKPVAVWMTQPVSFRLPKQQTRQDSRSSGYVPPTASGHFHVKKSFSNEFLSVFKADVKPKLLHSVEPIYPEEALEDKVEGMVILQCVVNVDGSVSDVAVVQSRGTIDRKEFQQAAIDAVSQYRFKPAENNGKTVAVWIPQAIRFRLPKE
ncbi:MAG: M56 family metallopeptidase [Gemmatimonadetes bacterium]|nr:M56 family metallopeptidase [Gemmatimonadota bacterium]